MRQDKKIENSILELLKYLGEKEREGLKETPRRVREMFLSLTAGLRVEKPVMKWFRSDNNEMVVKSGMQVYSLCEHHLLPMDLKVHFGYIPNGWVIGISKIPRIIKWFAQRPQIQEQLTEQIVDAFWEDIEHKPLGVICVIEGIHFCEAMRGVEIRNKTITSAVRGVFFHNDARQEFLKLIGMN